MRVELPFAHFLTQVADGILLRPGRTVRARRRQRVVDVDDPDDLCEQRDVIAAQPVRVAAAVDAFVVTADDRTHPPQRLERRAQRVADVRVALHQLEFLGRERAGLEQHRVGHADLADVVEIAASMQRLEIFGGEAERPSELDGELSPAARSVRWSTDRAPRW